MTDCDMQHMNYGLDIFHHWKIIGKNNENQYKNNIFII
jgi:hypothetical protein